MPPTVSFVTNYFANDPTHVANQFASLQKFYPDSKFLCIADGVKLPSNLPKNVIGSHGVQHLKTRVNGAAWSFRYLNLARQLVPADIIIKFDLDVVIEKPISFFPSDAVWGWNRPFGWIEPFNYSYGVIQGGCIGFPFAIVEKICKLPMELIEYFDPADRGYSDNALCRIMERTKIPMKHHSEIYCGPERKVTTSDFAMLHYGATN